MTFHDECISSRDIKINFFNHYLDFKKYIEIINTYGFYMMIPSYYFENANPLLTEEEIEKYLREVSVSNFYRCIKEYEERNKNRNAKKLIKKFKETNNI